MRMMWLRIEVARQLSPLRETVGPNTTDETMGEILAILSNFSVDVGGHEWRVVARSLQLVFAMHFVFGKDAKVAMKTVLPKALASEPKNDAMDLFRNGSSNQFPAICTTPSILWRVRNADLATTDNATLICHTLRDMFFCSNDDDDNVTPIPLEMLLYADAFRTPPIALRCIFDLHKKPIDNQVVKLQRTWRTVGITHLPFNIVAAARVVCDEWRAHFKRERERDDQEDEEEGEDQDQEGDQEEDQEEGRDEDQENEQQQPRSQPHLRPRPQPLQQQSQPLHPQSQPQGHQQQHEQHQQVMNVLQEMARRFGDLSEQFMRFLGSGRTETAAAAHVDIASSVGHLQQPPPIVQPPLVPSSFLIPQPRSRPGSGRGRARELSLAVAEDQDEERAASSTLCGFADMGDVADDPQTQHAAKRRRDWQDQSRGPSRPARHDTRSQDRGLDERQTSLEGLRRSSRNAACVLDVDE
jgi:hypothetical protein